MYVDGTTYHHAEPRNQTNKSREYRKVGTLNDNGEDIGNGVTAINAAVPVDVDQAMVGQTGKRVHVHRGRHVHRGSVQSDWVGRTGAALRAGRQHHAGRGRRRKVRRSGSVGS